MKATKVVSVFVRLLLAAAAFAVLGASALSAPRVSAAVGDTDDDGIPDAQDNCSTIANTDQSDDVSAWIISSSHNSTLYTPQNTWYAPQATSLIYVGDKLQVFCGVYNMLLCEEEIIQALTSSDWSVLAIVLQLSWASGMPSSSVSPTAALTRGADNALAPSTAKAAAASSKRTNTETTFVAFIIIILLMRDRWRTR